MIKINFHSEAGDDFKFNEFGLKNLIEEVLAKFSRKNSLVEIIFTTKDKMGKMNKKFRGKFEPTDVLSFPQTQFSPQKLNILGSIVICPEIAEEREESVEELVKHGLLHLLGYDHEADEASWAKAAKLINHNM